MPTGSVAQRFQRRQRRAGVGQLIAAAQGRNRQGAASGPRPARNSTGLSLLFGKAKSWPRHSKRAPICSACSITARGGRGSAQMAGVAARKSRLFAANRFARVPPSQSWWSRSTLVSTAQLGSKSVGGVQPAAQADFQHNHVHLGRDKGMHRRQGGKLKISQPGVAAPGSRQRQSWRPVGRRWRV